VEDNFIPGQYCYGRMQTVNVNSVTGMTDRLLQLEDANGMEMNVKN
jgi:hypothetical protein